MGSQKAPKAPDPTVQVNAESAANRYNIEGPSGSQTWTQGPKTIIGYDAAGKPQYGSSNTQHITLGDAEQNQYDTRNQIANQMLDQSQAQIGNFAQPFDYNMQGSKAGQAAYDRQMAYLQPDFDRDRTSLGDRLANQGLPMGSEAYNDEMTRMDKSQDFTKQQAAREAEGTGSQLALSQRQQQYNELAAALGSEQVTPVQAYGTQAAPIDVAGAYQNASNYDLARSNAGQSGQNALMGGLGQLGAAAITQWSDERLKEDIDQVGELPTGEGIYEYSYKHDPDAGRHTGVLAQEIETNYPDAVIDDPSGYKKVNYSKIAQAMAA